MYTPEFEAQVSAWARTQLTSERWNHTCGVVETAARLAAQFAPDIDRYPGCQ